MTTTTASYIIINYLAKILWFINYILIIIQFENSLKPIKNDLLTERVVILEKGEIPGVVCAQDSWILSPDLETKDVNTTG